MRSRFSSFFKSFFAKKSREKWLFLLRQILITGLNALTGFILLRGLNKTDYAVYTIIFSLLAIFTNITNVGITPALSGIGGRIWDKPAKLQALLNTALGLRHQLGWLFAGPFIIFGIWQFWKAGLHWPVAGILIGCLMIAAWVQLQAAMYAIVLQLNKAVRRLQGKEMTYVVLKIAGISILVWFHTSVAVVVAWICLCLLLNMLANKRLSRNFLEGHRETSPEYRKDINRIIRSNFFRTVYWSLEGQISVLLCTVFASTTTIAEIGALGRLGVYFAVFQAFIINYSLPQLARSQQKSDIKTQSLRILTLMIIVVLPILFWAVIHPDSLLWFLGPNYTELKPLLFYFLLSMALGQIAAVVYQMCAAKAWIELNRYYVPLALPLQIGLIYWLNLSNLFQVILLTGITHLFFLIYNLVMFYHAYSRFQTKTV